MGGTLAQDVFTLGGSIAARQANNALGEQQRLNQEAMGLRQQGIDYYNRYGQEAEGLRNQAKGGYEEYGNFGLSDRTTADANLDNLYRNYAHFAGFDFNPAQGIQTQPQQGSVAPGVRRPPGNTAAERLNYANRNNNQSAPLPQTPEPAPMQSPYALDESQQEAVNQQIATVNQQKQSAIEQYRTMVGGGALSPDVIARINDYYDQQANVLTTQAQEAARAKRQEAAAALIQQFTNQRNIGTGQYGQSLDSLVGLGSQALSQGANAPYFQAGAQTQQDAAQMGEMARYNQQIANARIGQMLQLALAAAGGRFGNLFGGGGSAGAGSGLGTNPVNVGQEFSHYIPGLTDPSQYNLFP